MKLRSTNNSIRIRVRKSELEKLATTGLVRETVTFPGRERFAFELQLEREMEAIQAVFHHGTISVMLPGTLADTWLKTDQVGLETNQQLQDGQTLHILIEKDFPCKDRPGEDRSDYFVDLSKDKEEKC